VNARFARRSSADAQRRHGRYARPARPLCTAAAAALLSALVLAPGPGAAAAGSAPAQRISLYHPGILTYYGFLEAPVLVRSAPSSKASVVERLGTSTADGTSMLVEPIAETTVARRTWYQIHMPVLPNWRTGWVPQSALGLLRTVRTRLIVNTEHLRATLIESGRTVFSAPIGIGKSSTPTPHGSFYVIDRLDDLGYGGEYGPLAFGTSAKSPVLTDWPGGGVVGVHGTNEPQMVPGHPSHGCIRMRNQDIVRLGQLMPVGTPVTIE
jgi:lipoprotein-anchoring transpeptidase ErfK/SrfK